jgi:hypothetical protein
VKNLSPSDLHRFWSKVSKGDSGKCWPWMATVNGSGHGRFFFEGRLHGAHRISFFIANGRLTDGLYVCHKCDNPPCCNPIHLCEGTAEFNVRDSVLKGRWHRFHQNINVGEANGCAKLTSKMALEIFHADGTHADIGKRYSVSAATVCDIKNRKKWGTVTAGLQVRATKYRRLTKEEVDFIKVSTSSQKKVARIVGISQSQVSRIRLGRLYSETS